MSDVTSKISSLKEIFESFSHHTNCKNWKIVGQEEDGSLLVTWTANFGVRQTFIGLYNRFTNGLKVLIGIRGITNVIQATVNIAKTILVYVTKSKIIKTDSESNKELAQYEYEAFISATDCETNVEPASLKIQRKQQIMAQFLYKKKEVNPDKFLLFIHQESVSLYQVDVPVSEETSPIKDVQIHLVDSVIKAFSWAQWELSNQCIYYIHYRKPPKYVEGEVQEDELVMPILSTLQFHNDMPHETVLNIPLNLPQLSTSMTSLSGVYEDDPIPLRIHDCSLDLTVVADHRGVVCICHHYLYQPVKPPHSEKGLEPSDTVHFAYSVTLLHHGRVVHCVLPGVLWGQASDMRPSFVMQGGLFVHLLDIGPSHEPCCHIVLPVTNNDRGTRLSVLIDPPPPVEPNDTSIRPGLQTKTISGAVTLNLVTMELVKLEVTPQFLISAYKRDDMILSNRLAILHYFMLHLCDMSTVAELLMPLAEKSLDLNMPKVLQEVLVGGAFASVLRNLSSDALPLLDLLPLTTSNYADPIEMKLNSHLVMSLNQESLWNPAVMLLSPQQRLIPYRGDMWTRLWDLLSLHADQVRFKPTTVADKLMVSLVCYQPEALSRCSTPLSPGGALVGSGGTLSDLACVSSGRGNKAIVDPLPFYEVESGAASKQEHIISVNLREVSMHLLKHGRGRESPMQVHAVATRYAAAQLELSRLLCQLMTKAAGVDTTFHERGFPLIEELSPKRRKILFVTLERYCFAVEALAFPLPQGFPSFLAFLAYRTLSFSLFIQYVQANVLQLQIDVMKAIMADLPDSGEGLKQKLRLLQLLPRSRAKRLLNQWQHPMSLMIRAREHALNILSGVEGVHARGHPQRARHQVSNRGLAAFPSADRLSPLDTFFDLLTAKASLAELDFNLLIAATMTSTEEFLE